MWNGRAPLAVQECFDVDEHQQRLERLRQRRDALTASGSPEDARQAAELDAEIAEAERNSLLGSGAPRTDTRLEGTQARCYVAVWMRQGPHGIDARRLRADATARTRAGLARLKLSLTRLRGLASYASVSRGASRRPGRVRTVGRARRGPARAAPARPRPADLRGIRGIGLTGALEPVRGVPEPGGLPV